MYNIYSKEPFDAGEIITTYLLGWVIYPLLTVGPIVLLLQLKPTPYSSVANIVAIGIVVWMILCVLVIIPLLSKWLAPKAPGTKPVPGQNP